MPVSVGADDEVMATQKGLWLFLPHKSHCAGTKAQYYYSTFP
jgi:hypothetical protein